MRQVDPATVANMLADLPLIDKPEEAKYLHLHTYRYIEILRDSPIA